MKSEEKSRGAQDKVHAQPASANNTASLFWPLLLVLLAFLPYLNAMQAGHVFDDRLLMLEHPVVVNLPESAVFSLLPTGERSRRRFCGARSPH